MTMMKLARKNKREVVLTLVCLVVAACQQKATTGTMVEEANEPDSFKVVYCQPVNGYRVQTVVKKEEHAIGLVADLTFSKDGKSFILHTTSFGDTVFNKGGWGMDGTNDELMEKYRGKTMEAAYHENKVDGKTMSPFTPFFFRDLDFDGVEELVIVYYSIAVRYHSGYDVYRIVDGTPVLIDYPPYKTHDDFGMTDYPEFNYRQKTISCPYPEGPGGQRYIGCSIYGVSRTRKDTVVVNGREYYFNHLEPVTNAR